MQTPRGHRTAELRSIEYHRLVAERLDAELLERARTRVEGWLAEGGPVPEPAARRWRDLLELPRDELRRVLTEDSESMRDLRQSTPFAGALSNQERWRIVRDVR